MIGGSIAAIGSLPGAISKIQDFPGPAGDKAQTLDNTEAQKLEQVVGAWVVDGEIEDRIRKTTTIITGDWFPGDTRLTWSIHKFSHKGLLPCVEVEPVRINSK